MKKVSGIIYLTFRKIQSSRDMPYLWLKSQAHWGGISPMQCQSLSSWSLVLHSDAIKLLHYCPIKGLPSARSSDYWLLPVLLLSAKRVSLCTWDNDVTWKRALLKLAWKTEQWGWSGVGTEGSCWRKLVAVAGRNELGGLGERKRYEWSH